MPSKISFLPSCNSMLWSELYPLSPKFLCYSSNPSCAWKAFRKEVKVKWGHESNALILLGLVPHEKRHQSLHSLFIMWGHSKKVATCKLGREISPEPSLAGTLDFHPPELWDNVCCLSYPGYNVLIWKAELTYTLNFPSLPSSRLAGYHSVPNL